MRHLPFVWSSLFALDKISQYFTGEIAANERVIFFPTAANQVNDTHWDVPIHGWIFEPKENSIKRKAFVKIMRNALNVSKGAVDYQERKQIVQRRVGPFLYDNRSYRRPRILLSVAGNDESMTPLDVQVPRSLKNGHFRTNLILHENELRKTTTPSLDEDHGTSNGIRLLPFHTVNKQHEHRFDGVAHLIPPHGVSIVTDIDDTIKISNYLNKKELLKNTFSREFKAVPGMQELFQQCQDTFGGDNNCSFHYVSASPYQLYEELQDFFHHQQDFPPATYHLKTIRPKDQSVLQLFSDPLQYKRAHLLRLFRQYPQRTFYLVGDSGEKDPEVYASLYRQYPDQVAGIWIRNVNNMTITNATERMEGVPLDTMTIFETGYELLDKLPSSTKASTVVPT